MKKNPTQKVQSKINKTVKGPKALFWYLTLFFTLGITAFSTGGLWFQFINKWLSKEIQYGQVIQSFSQSALKWEMASLIIAVPVFFIFSLLVRQALKETNLAADNKIRLWITYIILFLVVAVACGDLITTTFYLLNGYFTTRFLLKSLVILVVVSWLFIYYWLEIRSPKTLNDSPLPKIMGTASLVLILASFIGTFFIIESPLESRRKAFDRTRVMNLQEIKYAVDDYYREYQKLPISLEELLQNRGYLKIFDPKTGQLYQYQITNTDSYQLCAEFDGSNKNQPEDYYYNPPYNEFTHEAGQNCFDRKVSQSEKEIRPLPSPIPEQLPAD